MNFSAFNFEKFITACNKHNISWSRNNQGDIFITKDTINLQKLIRLLIDAPVSVYVFDNEIKILW